MAGFKISYVAEDGAVRRIPLAEALAEPFEFARPLRRFASRRGQRHLSGLWWSATTGVNIGFESWLERNHLLALDFDPAVTGIASQPFWLHWTDGEGGRVSHAPDYFARRRDDRTGKDDDRGYCGLNRTRSRGGMLMHHRLQLGPRRY